MYPVCASSFPSSIPGAPSTGWTILNSCSPLGRVSFAVSPYACPAVVASDMQVPLTFGHGPAAPVRFTGSHVFTRGNTGASLHTAPLGYEECPSTLVEKPAFAQRWRCSWVPLWDQVHTAAAISADVGGSAPLRETVMDAAFAAN